jgi:hypothetical protein
MPTTFAALRWTTGSTVLADINPTLGEEGDGMAAPSGMWFIRLPRVGCWAAGRAFFFLREEELGVGVGG